MAVTHEYKATVSWRGSTGEGYELYSREHMVTAPPAETELRLSSDPAFRGNPALLTPEQLLVLAAASCQLLSFLAVAARARIDVVGYEDTAHAEMPENVKPMHIVRILLRPVITIRAEVAEARLLHLTEIAHRECYIANSLKTEILVEPCFDFQASRLPALLPERVSQQAGWPGWGAGHGACAAVPLTHERSPIEPASIMNFRPRCKPKAPLPMPQST